MPSHTPWGVPLFGSAAACYFTLAVRAVPRTEPPPRVGAADLRGGLPGPQLRDDGDGDRLVTYV